MTKSKNLQIVSPEPFAIDDHPPNLGEHGLALWRDVQRQYAMTDAGGCEMLRQACQSADRAAALRDQIDRDGVLLRTKTGVRDHPLLKHEIAARSFVVRTLARLGLDLEPVRSGPGRPSGPRGI